LKASAPTIADNEILKDTSYFRVLNLEVSPFNDASTSLYHKSIGGYHGAKIKRYNELIDTAIYPEINKIITEAQNARTLKDLEPLMAGKNAINMLNTKYVIFRSTLPPLLNPDALGNVWFAETPLIVENPNEEISLINKIDPAKQAVIDIRFKNQITSSGYPGTAGDTIRLISYKPNELIYKYSTSGERLAVFSEIYYPAGWKAYLDGTEKSYFRTDYVLRGMVLPGGKHEIKFVFKPSSYYLGNSISLASSLIFILLVAGYFGFMLRSKPKQE
jgi:hypothetical protein